MPEIVRSNASDVIVKGKKIMPQDARDSYRMLMEIRKRMSDVFKDGLPDHEMFNMGDAGLSAWRPPFDMLENKEEFIIFGELPGMSKNDLTITLKGSELTVSGERRVSLPEDVKCHHLAESYHGSFSRSFRLTDQIDETQIKTAFDSGLLEIRIEKKQGRTIPIK